jgi:hypothetical protein
MPEVNLFNGGINTHKDSRKLEPNEFTHVMDADISSGSVVSIPIPIPSSLSTAPVGSTFTEYKDTILSGSNPYLNYQRMHNKMFMADGTLIRFTNGEVDINQSFIWYELGVDTPEDPISAKVLTMGVESVTFTKQLALGVSSPQTYFYSIVVDNAAIYDIEYECVDSCATIQVDTTSIVGTTVDVYRRWFGDIYFISSARVFNDFAEPIDYFPTVVKSTYAKSTYNPTYCKRPWVEIAWLGDGRIRLTPGADCSRSSAPMYLDCKTGLTSGTAFASGKRMGLSIKAWRIAGSSAYSDYKTFRFQLYDGSRYYFEIDITYESFTVVKAWLGNSYPNSWSASDSPLDLTVCNSRGNLLDIETTLPESQVGDFTYAITYEEGTSQESTGGPISNTIESRGANIEVTIPPLVLDPAIVSVHLYRQNGAVSLGYFRVATFTRAQAEAGIVVIDDVLVEDLGVIMPSRTLAAAPSDGLFITAVQGRLFMATKDDNTLAQDYSKYLTLRWSKLGNSLTWESLDFLNVDHPITGLGTCANGLVLFHRQATYILQGIQTESFTYRPISQSDGCIDHRSIQSWGGYSIFASMDGICMTDGGTVVSISYEKLGILNLANITGDTYNESLLLDSSNIRGSAVVGNTYFLLLTSNSIIKLDLIRNIFSFISGDEAVGIGHINGELYSSINQQLHLIKYDIKGSKTYKVVTGDITEQALCNYKEYNKVRVSMSGQATLNVFIDEEWVINNMPIGEASEFIGIPNESNKGYSIRFEVHGVGTLHSIEYTLKGRDNG